jgi:hypothetical protein
MVIKTPQLEKGIETHPQITVFDQGWEAEVFDPVLGNDADTPTRPLPTFLLSVANPKSC